MNTLKTITLNELHRTPLTDEEKATIRDAAAKVKAGKTIDDPDWYKPTKTEIHMTL
ncbi:MAG: hypothetical protein ACI4MA_09265 [Treponema sp.]